jgi:hypothetical protein
MLKAVFIMALLLSALATTMYLGTVHASVDVNDIPPPSVPEFTVKFVDRSYDVPVTYKTTIDPFTGQNVTTSSGGYRVTNKTIDITITNQPFAPVETEGGNVIQLYFSVRTKGHFGDWSDASSDNGYIFRRVLASTSEYTVVTLVIGSMNSIIMGEADLYIPEDGQEDFQVKADVGYLVPNYGGHILLQPLSWDLISFGESGWSNTQTYKVGNWQIIASPLPTTTPTPPPTSSPPPTPYSGARLSEQEIIIGVAIVAVVIGAGLGLLIYLIKRK